MIRTIGHLADEQTDASFKQRAMKVDTLLINYSDLYRLQYRISRSLG